MTKRQIKLSEQIRRAVNASALSRYAICKATKIDQAPFSRFMAGKVGMTMANLDAVAELLKLDLMPTVKARKGKVKHGKHRTRQ